MHNLRLRKLRWITGITFGLMIWNTLSGLAIARGLEISVDSTKWRLFFFGFDGLIVLSGLLFGATWFVGGQKFLAKIYTFTQRTLKRFGKFGNMLGVLLILSLPLIIFYPIDFTQFEQILSRFGSLALKRIWRSWPYRLTWFWLITLLSGSWLALRQKKFNWTQSVWLTGLITALWYRFGVFMVDIQSYPFTLAWSEVSRFYYASLFFGEKVYGQPVHPTVLHPTRYMLQSVPFIFGDLPLIVHRAWQVFLWIGSHLLVAWTLLRRIPKEKLKQFAYPAAFVGAWVILFLFQGPIWYHLVVVIIIVLWGVDTNNFWRTFFVVLVASAWAGISRVNWIPFPAALAAFIYLLEKPQGSEKLWRYLAVPFVWGLAGMLLGFVSQSVYAVVSGNALDQFASSFSSDLLWYRLLPSSTYPLGVLPGILLALFPIALLFTYTYRGRWRTISGLRWLGIGGILMIFFVGGIVVSTKIGGGSNLHNLDGLIALVAVLAIYLFFDEIKAETQAPRATAVPAWILILLILIPVGFALWERNFLDIPAPADAAKAYDRLVAEIYQAAETGEILFISERHMPALGMVENVPLVEDYEKVFLMEMAMSENQVYLEQFNEDLRANRFSLIITTPQTSKLKLKDTHFGEENNAWVTHVSRPLLCYYEELIYIQDIRIALFVPNGNTEPCLFQ